MAVLNAVRAAVRWLSLALLGLLVVTPLAQILMRGVFNVPMAGAEELGFLTASRSWRPSLPDLRGRPDPRGAARLIPPRPGVFLQLAIEVVHRQQFSILFVAGAVTISNNLSNQTATLEMPFWLFMGPLAVGSALLVVETAMTLVHTTWRRKRPEEKHTVLT